MRSLGVIAVALLCALPAHATQVFLTSGTTWTVPADWNNGANTIECIGPGGDGAAGVANTSSGGGGGGGVYVKISNRSFPIGAVLTVAIPAHGAASPTTLADNLGSTILSCDYGRSASANTQGLGGTSGASVGDSKVAGGNGGNGLAVVNRGGGSGGGSGGQTSGGTAAGANVGAVAGGAGGGGARGTSSTSGSAGTSTTGGNGGNGPAGTGAGAGGASGVVPVAGTLGGGGGGGAPFVGDAVGANGGCDTEFDGTHGACGGGGGGAGNATAVGAGGNGGTYGAGGGGGGDNASTGGAAGIGGAGLIAITYTPAGRSGAALGVGS